jgi:archaellum component FlaD/FlaE
MLTLEQIERRIVYLEALADQLAALIVCLKWLGWVRRSPLN